jgi:hypothetical protein
MFSLIDGWREIIGDKAQLPHPPVRRRLTPTRLRRTCAAVERPSGGNAK